jgi:hypothetical protein
VADEFDLQSRALNVRGRGRTVASVGASSLLFPLRWLKVEVIRSGVK